MRGFIYLFFVVALLGLLATKSISVNTYAKNKQTQKRKQEISTEASASVRLILATALLRAKQE